MQEDANRLDKGKQDEEVRTHFHPVTTGHIDKASYRLAFLMRAHPSKSADHTARMSDDEIHTGVIIVYSEVFEGDVYVPNVVQECACAPLSV